MHHFNISVLLTLVVCKGSFRSWLYLYTTCVWKNYYVVIPLFKITCIYKIFFIKVTSQIFFYQRDKSFKNYFSKSFSVLNFLSHGQTIFFFSYVLGILVVKANQPLLMKVDNIWYIFVQQSLILTLWLNIWWSLYKFGKV